MYKHLKQFVTRGPMIDKVSQYISGKVIKQTAQKLKIPLKDAMCMLVLDDWFDQLKKTGTQLWNTGKQFVQDNKDVIQPFLTALLSKIHPLVG